MQAAIALFSRHSIACTAVIQNPKARVFQLGLLVHCYCRSSNQPSSQICAREEYQLLRNYCTLVLHPCTSFVTKRRTRNCAHVLKPQVCCLQQKLEEPETPTCVTSLRIAILQLRRVWLLLLMVGCFFCFFVSFPPQPCNL